MAVIEGRTWLEVLTPAQSWELAGSAQIGRVAVLVDGRPEIYPVNFVVDDGSVVFRTDPGSKLRGLLMQPDTSFEVDGFDHGGPNGWSVLVKGRAEEVKGGPEAAHLATLPLHHWAHGEKSHWIRIKPGEITGRRLYRPKGRPDVGGS
jgi:nitroimidazol reductase NimA-like FMN-containing flavoprotein (pyridoxamine 5'-phosphate oxidase superfamily)